MSNPPPFAGPVHGAEMRRSTDFLEFVQAAGGFGSFDLNLVTGQVTGTPLFFQLTGLGSNATALTRDQWLQTVHPDDFEHVIQQLGDAILSAGPFQADYRSLDQAGAIRWLAARGQVLVDNAGKPIRAIGTVTDISERKQLEATLRYTTESLNMAQTVAGVATMDLDFGHKSWIASDNFHEILGIPKTTALHDLDGLVAAVHPQDFERVRRAPFDTTVENPSYRCDFWVVLPDGTLRAIAETSTVKRDKNGDLCRITGAFVDVTHLKRTEAALDLTEKRLARTMRGTRDGVWELDIATNRYWFGPQFEEMLGYTVGELDASQERFYRLISADDRQLVKRVIEAHLQGAAACDLEVRVQHKSGHDEWVRLRAQVERDASGQPAWLAGSMQLMTDRKLAEQSALDARFAAEAANAAKSNFLANVSLTGGDADFERELLETFIISGDQCLADIVAALGISDLDTVGKRAHSLKGASANIHAHRLSVAASNLENAARSTPRGDVEALVRQVGEKLRAVNAQLMRVS